MDYSTPGFPVLHHLWVCPNSCPLSQWCHPTISSSVIPFSSCPPSFPVSGSFPMSRLFTSGGQIIGALALASVLPMNIQAWFPLGFVWFDLLTVQGTLKSLPQHHSLKSSIYKVLILVKCFMFIEYIILTGSDLILKYQYYLSSM